MAKIMAHELPPLAYGYDALEPYIDKETMMLHHDKHHAAYVSNLNAALEKHPELAGKSAADLIRDLNTVPEDIRSAVRNNGGGHVNHSMFWTIMRPNHSKEPKARLADELRRTFGDFETFKRLFVETGTKQFGSGWVWLVRARDGKLSVISTANQDNPMSSGSQPIMGNDVWEHAYYLKYQNRRAEYLNAWWNVVNWDEVTRRFEAAAR